MNPKLTTFLAGIAVGACGAIFIGKLWQSDPQHDAELLPASPVATGTLPEEVSLPPPATLVNELEEEPATKVPYGDAGRPLDADQPQTVSEQPAKPAAHAPVPVSDAHKDLIERPDGGGQTDVHEELESEPEDDGWSYFMEQALTEFIGGHPNTEKFVVFQIECRTTLCEIQAIGYDGSTGPDWSRILYDLRGQPWQDFGQVGTSSSSYQGQLAIVTHLRRRGTESDQS